MEALTWSERFLTGVAIMDAQHERLVTLINAFGDLCANYAEIPRGELERVLDELAAYARSHFDDEEALMDRSLVDARFSKHHKSLHTRFMADVEHMQAAQFLATADTSRLVLRFLLHWLAFHILGTDKQLAAQIARIERGERPDEAYAAEVHQQPGSAGMLLGALDDMMKIVARRNEQLVEANAMLERRVAERTAALQHSVDSLRSMQAKLVEAEKLASVGQLASGLAHEINNPMSFISANLVALEEHANALLGVVDVAQTIEPQLPEEARVALQRACEKAELNFVRRDLKNLIGETSVGVERVRSIVRDLREFSRIDESVSNEFNINEAVTIALRMLPPTLRAGVTFSTVLGDVPSMVCLGGQVNQALMSLLQNAAQAVLDRPDATGTVTVSTGVDEQSIWVEVKDTGVGMTDDVRSHIFEPFFTTRPPGRGRGLGLTTAYNCAESHGGRIEVASVLHEGSTFRLCLPQQGLVTGALMPNHQLGAASAYNARRTPKL